MEENQGSLSSSIRILFKLLMTKKKQKRNDSIGDGILNVSELFKTKLEDLPNEMLIEILKRLDMAELINCSLLNKKFLFLVNSLRVFEDKLHFVNLERIDNEKYLCPFYQIESFDLKNSLIDNDIHFLFKSSSLFRKLFINLKELYFYTYVKKLDFKIFDKFVNLSKLYIRMIVIEKNMTINLPNLEDLSILSDYDKDYDQEFISKNYWHEKKPTHKIITIKSKIKKLKINNYLNNEYKFDHPELIKEIEILDRRTFNLTEFKNLKVLKLYNTWSMSFEWCRELENIERIYIDSSRILKELSRLRRVLMCFEASKHNERVFKNLKKVYLCHFEINLTFYHNHKHNYEEWKIVEDQSLVLEIQLKNYNLLTNYHKDFFDYSDLIRCLEKQNNLFDDLERDDQLPWLPSDFFCKFSNIRRVRADSLTDENEFLIFLKKCNALFKIEIDSSLSQNFLDQLPVICGKSLIRFSWSTHEEIKVINLDFVSGFNHLYRLDLLFGINSGLILTAMKNCKQLREIKFLDYDSKKMMKLIKLKKSRNYKFVGCMNETLSEYDIDHGMHFDIELC